MGSESYIKVGLNSRVRAQNAGLFISRGEGIHPKRIISSTEIIFVERGMLGIREGITNYVVKEGESIILEPGIEHAGTIPYGKDLKFYWIHFNELPFEENGKDNNRKQFLTIPKYKAVARPTKIIQLFRWFLHDQEEGMLQPIIANLIIYHLLAEISIDIPLGLRERSNWSYLLETAITVIRTRFAENLRISKIADEIGCNSDYLNRLFKRNFGTTISEYIKNRRLNYACNLLINSRDNIDYVAFKSGFNDPCYFRRCFKEKYGVTPKAYRNLYIHMHVNTE